MQELLAAEGEYASLYNVQAKAFAPPSNNGDTEPEGDDWSVSEEESWQPQLLSHLETISKPMQPPLVDITSNLPEA
jgi:hypothetical protein